MLSAIVQSIAISLGSKRLGRLVRLLDSHDLKQGLCGNSGYSSFVIVNL